MTARRRRRARFTVAIVGGGKVGQVLGRVLRRNGQSVSCVVSRTVRSARAAGRFIGCPSAVTLEAIPASVNLILIATPHDTIASVAESLAELAPVHAKKVSVCHTSGMLTAAALDAISAKGATVFSFHPLQTFPRDFHPRDIVASVKGITYGIDGTRAAVRIAKALAGALDGRTVVIPPHLREFYHATCVVASNHLTALLHIVELMYGEMGGRRSDFLKVFGPIVAATVENVQRTSPARALSGPVARGGVETIAGHLASLGKQKPDLLPYYVRMTEETVRLAIEKGSLANERAAALKDLLRSFDVSLRHAQDLT